MKERIRMHDNCQHRIAHKLFRGPVDLRGRIDVCGSIIHDAENNGTWLLNMLPVFVIVHEEGDP